MQGSTATFLVEIPELSRRHNNLHLLGIYAVLRGGIGQIQPLDYRHPLLSDDFEDGVIADVWQISGSVTETGGYLYLCTTVYPRKDMALQPRPSPFIANIPCHIVANVSIPSMDIYGGEGFDVRFPIGLGGTYITQYSGGPATITWAGASQPDVTGP